MCQKLQHDSYYISFDFPTCIKVLIYMCLSLRPFRLKHLRVFALLNGKHYLCVEVSNIYSLSTD